MLPLRHIVSLGACVSLAIGHVGALPNPNTQTIIKNRDAKHELPSIWPPPQQISASGCGVRLNRAVTIVTGNATDVATINAVKAIVATAGGTVTVVSTSTGQGSQILVGADAENGAAAAAAKALTGESAKGLAAEGYVLASGKHAGQPTIVLNGVDSRGTFYAAQTLRQLLRKDAHGIEGVSIRDWPLMPIRGSIEGFYGFPWSHQARLDQYVFYGKHKMNTYIYTPKDDPLLRTNWRGLYSGNNLVQLKELVEGANANHVDFTFALSPGLDICYSSDADFNATVAKFEQVRKLGVHSFYIALDDIPLEFHCDADKKKWPNAGKYLWLADAQAYYLNRVQKEYVKANNLIDLETVPTNYAGSAPDPYKGQFGKELDKNIRVQWTGEGVFSPNVTVESVKRADSTYVTDKLFIWDNFPVNDGMPHRLFLNPLTGRDDELYKHLIGFTANPMVQSYASMISLANYGDYTWNPPAYNADIDGSTAAILDELSGTSEKVGHSLNAFVDINQNWPYRKDNPGFAPQLTKDVADFWAARKAGQQDGTQALRDRLDLITKLPKSLVDMAMKPFAADVAPWSTLAMQWATASQHLIAMLDALDAGDKPKADSEFKTAQEWVEKTKAKTVGKLTDTGVVIPNAIVPTTGDGVFDKFVADATAIYKAGGK